MNPFSKNLVVVLITAFCLAISVSAEATVIKQLTIRQLTQQADIIFQGKVLRLESRWDEPHKNIWTFATFSVIDLIKGDYDQSEIILKLPGGFIASENIGLKVDGVPVFQPGEYVLIFSSKAPERICPIIGWFQGSFKIKFDEILGKKIIDESRASQLIPTKQAEPIGDGSIKQSMAIGDTTSSKILYKDFTDEIHRIMQLP